MKALRFHEFGEPSVLRIEEIPTPLPGDGDVLVQVKASSVNPSDVKNVAGAFPKTKPPRTPGRDFSGIVAQGPGHLIGKEIWGSGGDIGFDRDGSAAEYLVIPADAVFEKPRNLTWEQAAAAGTPFVTAWQSLVGKGALTGDDTVLITGAGGAVGAAAVQIALWKGARVIAAVQGQEQREQAARRGVRDTIDTRTEPLTESIKELTRGIGVTLAFETTGALFAETAASLAVSGRLAVITAPPDGKATFDLRAFYRAQAVLLGVDSGKLDVRAASGILDGLRDAFEAGSLKPHDDIEAFPLTQAAEAYGKVGRREIRGKAVITP
jgi:NADPH:quinone reductase-like Zn-dependent oxidoreductase